LRVLPGYAARREDDHAREAFTEEQIIVVLKEAEAGARTTDLCRRHGVSEQTFYRWKARYGGLEVR
jgi:putative transposase